MPTTRRRTARSGTSCWPRSFPSKIWTGCTAYAPHPLGPRLHELAEQRSHWYLARQEDWQRHGGSQPIEVDPVHRQAYEAVRAGIPAYLKLLDNPARDARALSAHLLSHFPEAAPQVVPALTARLAVEPDRVVAAFLCLATGMLGDQGDHELGAAVAARTDMPGKVERWTVLMGLVRLTLVPYEALLEQLCDCLFHGPLELYGWTFHRENLALGAYLALGELAAMSVPGLAAMLLERLAEGGDDESRFVYAVQLLLGLVFPEGPLPDGASPSDLSDQQRAAAGVVLRSGLLDSAYVARLLRECNLPADEETLSRWCAG
ncbi:hypothetical protein [Actinoplanes sp. NPDC026670]|uniref:hypothetical protein n=1 Tax=Actinoplanes sp. NPDC026670 TaxID=3154700 RepID=UPI0033CE6DD8